MVAYVKVYKRWVRFLYRFYLRNSLFFSPFKFHCVGSYKKIFCILTKVSIDNIYLLQKFLGILFRLYIKLNFTDYLTIS